jgi:hypothetical protein
MDLLDQRRNGFTIFILTDICPISRLQQLVSTNSIHTCFFHNLHQCCLVKDYFVNNKSEICILLIILIYFFHYELGQFSCLPTIYKSFSMNCLSYTFVTSSVMCSIKKLSPIFSVCTENFPGYYSPLEFTREFLLGTNFVMLHNQTYICFHLWLLSFAFLAEFKDFPFLCIFLICFNF